MLVKSRGKKVVSLSVVSLLFGIAAMAFLFASYQQKSRRRLLMGKLGADVCWACHYAFLGAYGGMIPNLSGIFRELVFVRREERAWANCPLWPVFFILVNFFLAVFSVREPIGYLPILASACVTAALWLRKVRVTKLIALPVSAAFLIYDAFVGSTIGMVNESLAILSVILYFIKNRKGESS